MRTRTSSKPGFTLVEMLVATALVVLMMLLFAQVFQVASGIVSDQKSMSKLDQSVRTLTILLRGDVRHRTFVDVVPFVANQDTGNDTVPKYPVPDFMPHPTDPSIMIPLPPKGYEAEFRKGFFSISENDPNDNTDDVLHLTITSKSSLVVSPSLPYYGKAKLLANPAAPDPAQYLLDNPDQPEFDDGHLTVNNTGSSTCAEVCWFIRHGKLYRRILLIRDPYYRGTNTSPANEPRNNADQEVIGTFYDHDYDGTPDYFWRDFDYSAYWEPGTGSGLKFHTNPESLQNQYADGVGFGPVSLGNPVYRFGSSTNRMKTGTIYPPREYITDGTNTRFIGRFTVQETADPDFKYPGGFDVATTPNDYTQNDPFNFPTATPPALPNPNDNPPGRAFTIDADAGLVSPYHDDVARRGEDVVMSDVHSFDIQVWDDGLVQPAFVNLGHGGTTGHYRSAANQNPTFGNRYDTWHPSEFMPSDPPFAPFAASDDRANYAETRGLGTRSEVWLKAIQIKVRVYDLGSEKMRDLTFTFRLDRDMIGKE